MDVVQALILHRRLTRTASPGRSAADQRSTRLIRAHLRRVLADNAVQLDIICRLQFLEGVAGVRPGVWAEKASRGLSQAESFFEDQEIDPDWFSTRSTGMYKQLRFVAQKALSSSAARNVDAEDIIQDLLADGMTERGQLRQVGVRTEPDMLRKNNPMAITNRFVTKFLFRRILSIIRTETSHMRMDKERGIEDPSSWMHDQSGMVHSPGQVLEDVFLHRGDALGKKIRDFMRKTWKDSPLMVAYVDLWERFGRLPKSQEVAEAVYAEENGPEARPSMDDLHTIQKRFADHWKRYVPKLDEAWRSSRLRDELEARFLAHGVSTDTWDPEDLFKNTDPKMFGKFPQWKATAQRVAARWLHAHTVR